MKIYFSIVSFLLFIAPAAYADQNIITINYPPDKTVMEFNLLSISMSVPAGAADLIIINVDDRESYEITPDSETECFTVPIRIGLNGIKITAIKNNNRIDEIVMSVFRRSDLVSVYKEHPAGYAKDYFHMKERRQCTSCHTLEPGDSDRKPVDITAFPDEKLIIDIKALARESTCNSCHRKITSYPFVHGPASVWSCLSCHETGADPVYSVRKPYTKVCYGCHIRQKEIRQPKKYKHGPINTGKCTVCHNPHASEHLFNLVKSIWDLCVSCHVEKGSGRHIVEGYFSTTPAFHPTRGVPDPLREGKELSCTSCHDPHASDAPKLWRFDVGSGFELCRKCHGK